MPAPSKSDPIDWVDGRDRVVGTIPRGEALNQRAGFRVVHVLVLNTQGELLLQRIADNRTRSPGRWGSSVAGYLHAGEEPLQAARRRLREEIGLQTPLRACGRTKMLDDGSDKFIHVFLTHAETAQIMDPLHIQELQFWARAQIEDCLRKDPDVFSPTFPFVLQAARDDLDK